MWLSRALSMIRSGLGWNRVGVGLSRVLKASRVGLQMLTIYQLFYHNPDYL